MDNPKYTGTIKIGGPEHVWTFDAAPINLQTKQSFDMEISVTDQDDADYVLSGGTFDAVLYPWDNSVLAPIPLATGVTAVTGSPLAFTVDKDVIVDDYGLLTFSSDGSAVISLVVTDGDSSFTIYQRVTFTNSNFLRVGDGNNISFQAANLIYDPTVPTDWPDPDPVTVEEGLDQSAARLLILENTAINNKGFFADETALTTAYPVGQDGWYAILGTTDTFWVWDDDTTAWVDSALGTGDMIAAIYDPQSIVGDAFARVNMTGTQLAATISDFSSAVSSNAAVAANTSHAGASSNPHSVSAVQVGNGTAQWNADEIQGNSVLASVPGAPEDGFGYFWNNSNNRLELSAPPGAGGGEANTASNVGTGVGVFKQKSVLDLEFHEITGGDNVDVALVSDDIQITVTDASINAAIDQQAQAAGDDNNQTGTAYTLVLSDADNKTVWMNNAAANEVTIPLNASVAYLVKTKMNIQMEGAGVTTITGDTGVTVNGVSGGSVVINNQFQGATLSKRGTDTWIVTGDIT